MHIPEDFFAIDRSLVAMISSTMPPRNPNDDDDDDDDEDNDTESEDDEPAVIREPDEDE